MASTGNNDGGTSQTQNKPAINPGDLFAGVYEIVRLLGEGGMGSVYLARDTRVGGREVALKVLYSSKRREDSAMPEPTISLGSLGLQSHEARLLASCEHSSILPVYDAGTDQATGLAFFTMRACLLSKGEMRHLCDSIIGCPYPRSRDRMDEGPCALTLRDLLRGDKALPEAAVARLGIDIVEALAYTHARRPSLIHRDIKPSNILFDASGWAILSDFGIAKESSESQSAVSAGTSGFMPLASSSNEVRRSFAGTSAYAAPEQKRGGAATQASDYYSLGVVLHEALTGERIFGSTPPSRFDRGRISRRWDRLLPRMLAEDPRERLSDPQEILHELRAIARGASPRRWRILFLLVASVVLVVAGYLAAVRFAVAHDSQPSNPIDNSPEAIAARSAEVRSKVEQLIAAPEWPEPAMPWFQTCLFAPRPENNRRHPGWFEMILPGGVPMQFSALSPSFTARFVDYPHGFFIETDGKPNMTKDEKDAARTVASKRLLFSRTEVTREQFDAVMSATNAVPLQEMTIDGWTNAPAAMAMMGMGPKEFYSRLRFMQNLLADEGKTLADFRSWAVMQRISQDKPFLHGMPAAEGLRFADVQKFIDKLNSLCPRGCIFRLPSEAEWEAMCRHGDDRRFEGNEPDEVCWSAENSGCAAHPVGMKKPNFYGIYDMHGNVAEWCLDGFGPMERPAFDPVIPVSKDGSHVVKGGSWEDPAAKCSSECRRRGGPEEMGIGFRLVLEY